MPRVPVSLQEEAKTYCKSILQKAVINLQPQEKDILEKDFDMTWFNEALHDVDVPSENELELQPHELTPAERMGRILWEYVKEIKLLPAIGRLYNGYSAVQHSTGMMNSQNISGSTSGGSYTYQYSNGFPAPPPLYPSYTHPPSSLSSACHLGSPISGYQFRNLQPVTLYQNVHNPTQFQLSSYTPREPLNQSLHPHHPVVPNQSDWGLPPLTCPVKTKIPDKSNPQVPIQAAQPVYPGQYALTGLSTRAGFGSNNIVEEWQSYNSTNPNHCGDLNT